MSKKRWIFLRILCLFVFAVGTFGWISQGAAAPAGDIKPIEEWRMNWGGKTDFDSQIIPKENDPGWIKVKARQIPPVKPAGETTAWIQFELPEVVENGSFLIIDKIYALNVKAYVGEELVFESNRDYLFDLNEISIPMYKSFSEKTVSIWIETTPSFKRLGLSGTVTLNEYIDFVKSHNTPNFGDNLMSGGLLFASLTVIICGLLQGKNYRRVWISLGVIILSAGIIVISTQLLSLNDPLTGHTTTFLYDTAMAMGLLMLSVFFEGVFGPGRFLMIRRFRIFQIIYSALCIILSFLTSFIGFQFVSVYLLFTTTLLGYIIIAQFAVLLFCSINYAIRGNKEAVIFTAGFTLFALVGLSEMAWYYLSSGRYEIHWWRWGLFAFMIALLIIVGRTVASSYRQLVKYSKELELFNNQLQRSEKMDIISELAASVAHEVRNPLQVTRGFLQLLDGKYSSSTDKTYVKLALNELDRAAGIITDFLTFAKPGIEDVVTLNLALEFEQVENILQPLAHLNGGKLSLKIPEDLYTKGNSSKFKQAIVNIVKNSIEAFQEEGAVDITARSNAEDVLISIRDNGEGMSDAEIARLGEPYFSNKTKGTGLGLMVTFRIIEAMKGTIQFKSQKGKGTEVLIRLPKTTNPTAVPKRD